MEDQGEIVKGYAFVDSISKPSERTSPYQRINLVLDVISAAAIESDRGRTRDPKDLSIIRIMSTLNRLQTHFSVGDIAEGTWFYVSFQDKEGNPPAWILNAENDYSGPIRRINLVGLQPLSMGAPNSPESKLFASLSELCNPTREQNTQNLKLSFMSELPRSNYHVRVVDVGHANFSAIHLSREPDSDIIGYYDVGGPVFFHHHTFPKLFAESGRVPKKGFVALSHWDFDHYSLALTKLKNLQQQSWYAPDQKVGPSAARLQYLLGTRLTLLVQPSFRILQGLNLWKGKGPMADRNASGYVLTASNRTTKVLLTGDVPYDMIPAKAKCNLSALSITHHGGSGSGTPPSPKKGTGDAAVSYGLPNRYHHPDLTNLKNHAKVGWTVKPTFRSKTKRCDVWI